MSIPPYPRPPTEPFWHDLVPPVLFALVVGAIFLVGALFALVGPLGIVALLILVAMVHGYIGDRKRKS